MDYLHSVFSAYHKQSEAGTSENTFSSTDGETKEKSSSGDCWWRTLTSRRQGWYVWGGTSHSRWIHYTCPGPLCLLSIVDQICGLQQVCR